MTADLQPYPAYGDSGLLWLGRIPAEWKTLPNRAFLRRRKVLVGRRHPEYTLLSLTKAGVVKRDISTGKGKFSADMGTCQEVHRGDLIFCLFDVPETPRTVGRSPHEGMITGAYTIFECNDPLFAAYVELFYKAMDDRKLLSPLYSGLRNTIPPSTFLGTKTPVPPPIDQTAIVRFLHHHDRLIRTYIRAKQRLIALLTEQKQAIIQRAVTRGLNPDVKLKPSGVLWLGDIPGHWEQHALWTLSRLRTERNPGGLQLLSVFLHRGVIRYEEGGGQVHAPSLDLSNYQVVHPGDFVLNNQQAWRGSVGVSSYHGIISPAYIVLQLSKRLHSPYADYLLQSRPMVDQFVAASKGVGDIQRQIFWPFLRTVQVPVPTLEVQKEIAAHLDHVTQGLNKAVARAEREIALMREYHTRLTSDAVTGKVDVRAIAAGLPPELPDTAESDDVTAQAEEQEALDAN